jgi:hypothetical protein
MDISTNSGPGHIPWLRATLVLALGLAALVLPGLAHASLLPPDTSHPGYVQFTNSAGSWRIYTGCGSGAGPGYIAYATHSGKVILDDTNSGQQDINTPGSQDIRVPQGIGKFVYREARAPYKAPLNGSNTFLVDGKYCAGPGAIGVNDGGDPSDPNRAANAPHQIGPIVTTYNTDGTPQSETFRFMVTFRDQYSPRFVTVTYVWRFWDTHIQLWSDVIQRCSGPTLSSNNTSGTVISHGECSYNPVGANYPDAWIKGPKYILGLGSYTQGQFQGNLPWTRIATRSPSGGAICGSTTTGATGLGFQCPGQSQIYSPSDPHSAQWTQSQCTVGGVLLFCWSANPDPRAWVQFQTTSSSCAPDCFNAVVRAYPPDGNGSYYPSSSDLNDPSQAGISPGQSALNWVSRGNYYGMDQWAQNEDLMAAQNFNGPACSNSTQRTPYEYRTSRVWEALGDKYSTSAPYYTGGGNWMTASDPYTFAGYYFFGWRDCINVPDDPLIFRSMEGYDSNYGTYASFSFTTNLNGIPPATNG